MTRRTTWTIAMVALLGILAVVAMHGGRDSPPGPSADALGTVDESTPVERHGGDIDATSVARTESDRVVADHGSDRRLAIIRGRCVDESRKPLAGVAVHMTGSEASAERMQRHRLDGGEVEWSDPADVITGDDGRFEFRFDPPPPYQFVVEARAPGRVRVSGSWSRVEPGSVIHTGDLVLPVGVEVTGRLVDRDGNGLAERTVGIRATDPTRAWRGGLLELRDFSHGRTDSWGRFHIEDPLRPGSFRIELREVQLVEPQGEVTIALPRAELQIVAAPLQADTRPAIAGRIVDIRGEPIVGASIGVGAASAISTHSRKDGAFEIRKDAGDRSDRVMLHVDDDGCEPWQSVEPIAWGTSDLRIVLVDGPPLTIRVRRTDTGKPVERFGVQLARTSDTVRWSSDDLVPKYIGSHPGGVLEIPRVAPGACVLVVLPARTTGLPQSPDRRLTVERGVARAIDIEIAPYAERWVEVVDKRGAPIASATIELLEHPLGLPVDLSTRALDPDNARRNSPLQHAILHAAATTDAGGRAKLRARSGQDYALRLPGPGLLPKVVQPFRLEDAAPAHIEVSTGATLRLRFQPASVVQAWRESAGLPAHGRLDPQQSTLLPSVSLHGARARIPGPTQPRSQFILTEDGTCIVTGIPAGVWDVHLEYSPGPVFSTNRWSRLVFAKVELAADEDRELTIDATSMMMWPVIIDVLVDGKPHLGRLMLKGDLGASIDGRRDEQMLYADSGGDGKQTFALPAGNWTTYLLVTVADVSAWIPGPGFVVGTSGVPMRITGDLRTASRQLVVLDPDGKPAAGIALQSRFDTLSHRFTPKPTDAEGRTTVVGPPCSTTLSTRCAPLREDMKLLEWVRQHPGEANPVGRATIDLGSLELVPGGAQSTIRLPAAWNDLPK